MASPINVQIIGKETIKPSSPTPQNLRSSGLCFFDQLMPDVYVSLLLFYNDANPSFSVPERTKLLKTSLSEALTKFYPLAGKFQYNDSICCNDQGTAFLEAQVNCPISKILEKPDLGNLGQFLPNQTEHAGYLLQIQVNLFECGGMAIGVKVFHKAADASTISKFINSWAAISLGPTSTRDHLELPLDFDAAASLFPPLDFLNTPQSSTTPEFVITHKCLTRRFVFDASKIAALRSKAASETVSNPTRVQVVSALIWKCAMEASRSNLGSTRPSFWCESVNMRKIVALPFADCKDLMGSVVTSFAAEAEQESCEDRDLPSLVAKLRQGIDEFKVKYGNGISGEDVCQIYMKFWSLVMRDDIDNYICSSWCRFPFYEANFGWGKPCWLFIPSVVFKNILVLMDARDGGGIEGSLTFKEEDMLLFENNKELLQYASLNPTLI